MSQRDVTVVGTNINDVKQKNAQSGLSYNEVKALLAQTGGKGTAQYSNTYVEAVKNKIHGN